jgi:Cu/Ag efflux protein CusF
MRKPFHRFLQLRALGILVSLGLIFSTESLSATPGSDPIYRYTVRGVLRNIGSMTSAGSREVIIKHEEIPDYRDEAGERVGMRAMTMPFYLEDGLDTGNLTTGDPVEFVVAQWSEPAFRERIVSIRRHDKTDK